MALDASAVAATRIPDVTYVTPIDFVLKTFRGNKSLAKAYPESGLSA
jgi:hypothetical protein